jgi:hypothetical protein
MRDLMRALVAAPLLVVGFAPLVTLLVLLLAPAIFDLRRDKRRRRRR